MQPLTSPPREQLTDAQVHALLTGPQVTIAAGLELLDGSNRFVADISEDLVDGSVSWDNQDAVHGSARLSLQRALAWGRDRVRPYMVLSGGPTEDTTEVAVDRPGDTIQRTDTTDADYEAGALVDTVAFEDTLRLDSNPDGASYPGTVLADAPLGYWRLGETTGPTTPDASPNGRTGTYKRILATDVSTVTRGAAGALAYDSDTAISLVAANRSWVDLGNPTAFKINTGAIEFWFKTTSVLADFQGLVLKQLAYGLYLHSGRIRAYNYQTGAFFSPATLYNDGAWHHVVYNFANGVTNGSTLYVDGVLTGTFTTNQSTDVANRDTQSLTIGAGSSSDTAGQYITAAFDEVVLYGSQLSAARVAARYEVAKGAKVGGGNSVTNRATTDTATGFYWFDTNNPIAVDVPITQISAYVAGTQPFKFLIGRKVGSAWSVVGKSATLTPTAAGVFTATIAPINAQAGDFVGIYHPGGASVKLNDTTGAPWYYRIGAEPAVGPIPTPEGPLSRTYSLAAEGRVPVPALLTAGSWTSPPVSLADLEAVSGSQASWVADLPAGSGLTVQTSVDDGATWQDVTNGGPIPGAVPGGTVRSRLLLTGDGTATPAVGSVTLTVQQAPTYTAVTTRTPIEARFNLGVYVPTVPAEARGESPATFEVTAYDLSSLLQTGPADTYEVTAGGTYFDACRAVVTDSGIGVPLLLDGTAQAVTIPATRVWAVLDPAPSWLRILTDLLAEVGYVPPWVDPNGNLRSRPFMEAASRTSEWTLDTSDPATNLVGEDRTITTETGEIANWWRFVLANADVQPVEGDGIYTPTPNLSEGPNSIDALGREVRKLVRVDAADHAALVAQGDRIRAEDMASVRTINLTVDPLPIMGFEDVFTFTDAGTTEKVAAMSWELNLDGSPGALQLGGAPAEPDDPVEVSARATVTAAAPLRVVVDGAETDSFANALDGATYSIGDRVNVTVRNPVPPLVEGIES